MRDISLSEIAALAGVRTSAVSNWRGRHPDFPATRLVSGQERFDLDDVVGWLMHRAVPKNSRRPDEIPGTTYGDRIRRQLADGPSDHDRAAPPNLERPSQTQDLWRLFDRLRSVYDVTALVEYVLTLLFLRLADPPGWRSLVDRFSADSLFTLVDGIPGLPGGRSRLTTVLAVAANRSASDMVRIIDSTGMPSDDSASTVVARLADDLLGYLERGSGRMEYVTPSSVVRCMIAVLEPQPGESLYDPFCRAGELLVGAHVHSRPTGEQPCEVFGQTINDSSTLLSFLNLALHGAQPRLRLGEPGPWHDEFAEQRFDIVLANPPFNLSGAGRPEDQPHRWPFGMPPRHNANFAWLQYVVTKLARSGRAAVLMPNSAGITGNPRERAIREAMIRAGVVDAVIALPPRLFKSTAIPTTLWLLHGIDHHHVSTEVLLVDAHDLPPGDRAQRILGADEIGRIAQEYRSWVEGRARAEYQPSPGFARAVSHLELASNNFVVHPTRYVQSRTVRRSGQMLLDELDLRRDDLFELRERALSFRHTFDDLDRLVEELSTDRSPRPAWREVPLRAVADVLAGPGTIAREKDSSSVVPVVLPRNVRGNRVNYERLDLTSTQVSERYRRYRLAAGDIVCARTGTLGRYGLVGEDQAGWLLGPGCMRLRPTGEVEPRYLTQFLGGPAAYEWLMQHATGSAITQINTATLGELPVRLPPIEMQYDIATILDEFDDAAAAQERAAEVTRAVHDLVLLLLDRPTA